MRSDVVQQAAAGPEHRLHRRLIALLAALAFVRILIFSAAYPPFLFIDEPLHYENVVKYAQVGLPGAGEDNLAYEAVRVWVEYGIHGPGAARGLTPEQRRQAIDAEARRVAQYRNCETYTPPLYYALAAGWYRVGIALLGLDDPARIYWLRFLAAPLYGLTVWLAGRLCLRFHAARPELALGAGLILLALPQDILYTINSDVASPLAVAVVLFLVAAWLNTERSIALAAAAGLAAAIALLVKYSNVAAPAALGAALLVRLVQRRGHAAEVGAMAVCALVPLAAWMAYCQIVLGDWTATRHKADMLGWTTLTFSQSLEHPIFGPLGMMEFAFRLAVTFWRGELIWGERLQRVEAVDFFYLVVTALGLLGTIGWLLRPSSRGRGERGLALVYFAAVAGSVLFLALISARFDYGRCFFPSRGFPYFAAGRLLTGVIVPFAILLVGGLQELLAFTGRRYAGLACAALIALVCLGSEIYLCCVRAEPNVFTSPHNFYDLLAALH